MSLAVGEPTTYVVQNWVEEEMASQTLRNEVLDQLTRTMEIMTEQDQMARETFRTTLAMYDNAARMRDIALPIYKRPCGWPEPQPFVPWESDVSIPFEWSNYGNYVGDDRNPFLTPPSSSNSSVIFASTDSDSDGTHDSMPSLTPMTLEEMS